jgi:hypothetical protein
MDNFLPSCDQPLPAARSRFSALPPSGQADIATAIFPVLFPVTRYEVECCRFPVNAESIDADLQPCNI